MAHDIVQKQPAPLTTFANTTWSCRFGSMPNAATFQFGAKRAGDEHPSTGTMWNSKRNDETTSFHWGEAPGESGADMLVGINCQGGWDPLDGFFVARYDPLTGNCIGYGVWQPTENATRTLQFLIMTKIG
jgi:hypothetical protein